MVTTKEILRLPEPILAGHAACAGCSSSLGLRYALKALGEDVIMSIPACCTSVWQGPYPKSSISVPVLNIAFAAAASAASGISGALQAKGNKDTTVLAWAGDGGTTDIGLQGLSGAAERNENIIFVCYDNEAYMNTGIQRSSATPYGAFTTTAPPGKLSIGQITWKKNMVAIAAAHDIPYVATACPSYPFDLIDKVRKGAEVKGPAYVHILSPCPTGWRYSTELTIEIGKLAVETGIFPLYEVEEGKYKMNVEHPELKPIREYLELQGRFRHLPDEEMEKIQQRVEKEYHKVKDKCGV